MAYSVMWLARQARLSRGIENGYFRDIDELLIKALDAVEKERLSAWNGKQISDWRRMRGMARGNDRLTDALVKERSAEKAHDEARIKGH